MLASRTGVRRWPHSSPASLGSALTLSSLARPPSQGSDLVYRHLLRPVLSMYDRPLELIFSLVYVLVEAILAVAVRPALAGLSSVRRRVAQRWSGPPPKPGSTAALLEASKDEMKTEADRAREVVKEAREVYDEIARLQQAPRPLARAGSGSGAGVGDAGRKPPAPSQGNAVAGPSSRPAVAKSPAARSTLAQPALPPARASSTQPSARRPASSSSLRPASASAAGRQPPRPQLKPSKPPTSVAAAGKRPAPARAAPPKQAAPTRAAAAAAAAPQLAQPRPRRPLSPPPLIVTMDDFLLQSTKSQPSPVDFPRLDGPSAASPAPFGIPDEESAATLYPFLGLPSSVLGGSPLPISPAPARPSGAAVIGPLSAATAPPPTPSISQAPPTEVDLHVDLAEHDSTLADSPARRAFEAHRASAAPLPNTPAPPGSFLRSAAAAPKKLRARPEALILAERSDPPSQGPSTTLSRLSTPPPADNGPSKPAPTPKRARPPPTPSLRATPARRAKQSSQAPAGLPALSASPTAPSSGGGGSAKRRKVSERWEYVPVLEVEKLDELDLAEGKRKVRSETVVVNIMSDSDTEDGPLTAPGEFSASAAAPSSTASRRTKAAAPVGPPKPAPAPSRSTRTAPKASLAAGKSIVAAVAPAPAARPTHASTSAATASAPVTARAPRARATRTAAAAPPSTLPGSATAPTRASALRASAPAKGKASALAGGPVRVARRTAQASELAQGPSSGAKEDG